MTQPQGTVTIAPHALTSIISRTALEIPGVARMGTIPPRRVGELLTGGQSRDGVLVRVSSTVSAELFLVAHHDVNLLDLGTEVQAAVANALREMVGMPVHEINVYIQDIEAERVG
ncbi:MAG TPA: Asp23/Gls24 family envelope stress response protein [Herpetosiphonaceae bacterium]|nr:Asp23/Gls24 family envelope stress response protein [Herpetosiphonaceae bacterium]